MIYEIHVSIELNGFEEAHWAIFCKKQGYHRIRVVNDKGVHNVQNMMSKYVDCASHAKAILQALVIECAIKESGFHVLRTKVEGMLNSPGFKDTVLTGEPNKYWEFHFKVNTDWIEGLQDACRGRPGVGISMSTRSDKCIPTVTLRIHNGTRDKAIEEKDKLVKHVVDHLGVSIHEKIQMECSVFDTFPGLDEGWFN